MNSTGFLTACIVALAGVSASLTPFAERAKNQETKKPGRAWKATGLFCTAFNRITPVPRRADSFESPRYCRSLPNRQQEKSPLNRRGLSACHSPDRFRESFRPMWALFFYITEYYILHSTFYITAHCCSRNPRRFREHAPRLTFRPVPEYSAAP